jgi:hypothetical protein
MDENSPKTVFISDPINLEDGIVIRLLREDGLYRDQMLLVIDEYTNFDSINLNRKVIKDFFKFLERIEGSDLNYKHKEYLFALLQWHEQGISWGKMTVILNYLGYALTYCAYIEKNDIHGEISEEMRKTISEPSFVASLGGAGLIFIFLALGMTFYEFNSWMKLGYEYLAEDRFIPDITKKPFEWKRVREKVRYIQESIETNNKIWISEEDSNWNSLEYLTYLLIQKGYFIKLSKLLDKGELAGWERNKTFLHKWVDSISAKWENSQDPKIKTYREIYKKMGKS